MIDPPRVAWTDESFLATIAFSVPPSGVRDLLAPAVGELKAVVAAQQVRAVAPWCMHYLRLDATVADFEVCVPVSRPIARTGRVVGGVWPRVRVARTTHHGPYHELASAWAAFRGWLKAERHDVGAEFWECYVCGPEVRENPRLWRTDLVLPLVS